MDIDTPSSLPPGPQTSTSHQPIPPATPPRPQATLPSSLACGTQFMHPVFNLPFPSNSKVPKGPVVKLPHILQPANLFAYALPPIWTLPRNWRRPGSYCRNFTIPKESTNKRLDLPLLQLITSGANADTHILDRPGTLGTLQHPNNHPPPLTSKVNLTHCGRTWTRSSPPWPTSLPVIATTQDPLM